LYFKIKNNSKGFVLKNINHRVSPGWRKEPLKNNIDKNKVLRKNFVALCLKTIYSGTTSFFIFLAKTGTCRTVN
jgi:hypothetical protein